MYAACSYVYNYFKEARINSRRWEWNLEEAIYTFRCFVWKLIFWANLSSDKPATETLLMQVLEIVDDKVRILSVAEEFRQEEEEPAEESTWNGKMEVQNYRS